MPATCTPYPARAALTAGLSAVLSGPVAVLKRRRNLYASTFASEVVTCRLPDGEAASLLCKYGAGPTDVVYGHKGGVVYEAEVYREVLRPVRELAPTPAFHGAYSDAASGLTWLVLDYIAGGERLHLTADPVSALEQAARWLGNFHAVAAARWGGGSAGFLNAYDADYYRGWARRTAEFAGPLHDRFPWLRSLCDGFEELCPLLLARPVTVIHGEYYPKNVLLRGGAVYPVDWESAAVAAGEIDLASLTEAWPADVVRRCEEGYGLARGPAGPPGEFGQALAVARLYGMFRWLGDRPELTVARGAIGMFKQLRSLGRQLGVI